MSLSAVTVNEGNFPPSKRQRITPAVPGTNITSPKILAFEGVASISTAACILPHPLQVKPSGNAYISVSNLRNTSAGLFAIFSDELIIEVLECLDAASLALLGATGKAFYAFSRHEELWKTLFIEYVFS